MVLSPLLTPLCIMRDTDTAVSPPLTLCGCGVVVRQMKLLPLHGLQALRNEKGMNSWATFAQVLKCHISNTTMLNLVAERGILNKTLFRVDELIHGGSDPYHIFRAITMQLIKARGVSSETLNVDPAAMKAIFNATGGGKSCLRRQCSGGGTSLDSGLA